MKQTDLNAVPELDLSFKPTWQNRPDRSLEPWAQGIIALFPDWEFHWSKLLERLEITSPNAWFEFHVVPPNCGDQDENTWGVFTMVAGRTFKTDGPDAIRTMIAAWTPMREIAFDLQSLIIIPSKHSWGDEPK